MVQILLHTLPRTERAKRAQSLYRLVLSRVYYLISSWPSFICHNLCPAHLLLQLLALSGGTRVHPNWGIGNGKTVLAGASMSSTRKEHNETRKGERFYFSLLKIPLPKLFSMQHWKTWPRLGMRLQWSMVIKRVWPTLSCSASVSFGSRFFKTPSLPSLQ